MAGRDGVPVRFATRKARQLFAYLALTAPQRHPRVKLAALFWSDRGERQARGSLRHALTAIRRALGPAADVLAADHETVGCHAHQLDIDAVRVRQLAMADTTPALDELRQSYTGPLLDGVEAADPAFEAWMRDERRACEAQALAGLRRLTKRHLEGGNVDAAQRAAERTLEIDPTCEEAARDLIRLIADQGDRGTALHVFEALRGALADRYDANAEPETEALVARLRLSGTLEPGQPPPEMTAPEPTWATLHDEAGSDLARREAAAIVVRPRRLEDGTGLEEDHARRGAWRAEVEAAIVAEGGRSERFGADAVLGLFGAVTSFGDDCLRAARAAFAIFGGPGGAIGLSNGAVVVEQGALFSGPAIETASALSRSARPGDLLICPRAANTLADRVVVETQKSCTRVISLNEPPLIPFVGRRAELTQIEAALQVALEDRRGRVFHIRGEPGIGKTRLAAEAARISETHGYTCRVAHVLDFGGASRRDAIRAMLRELLGTGAAREPRTTTEHALTVARRFMSLSDAEEALLYDLLDAPQATDRAAILDAMSHTARNEGRRSLVRLLVAAAARQQPLFLLFEDIHWADKVTLAGLAAYAGATVAAPVVVMVTSRIEGDQLDAGWRARTNGASVSTIDLGPMDVQEARALAAALTSSDSRDLDSCIDRAGGNPLFLEQLLRFAIAGKRSADMPLEVPASLRSVAQARLDLVDPETRDTLTTASVLGQSFTGKALAHLLECDGIDEEMLTGHGMVRAEGGGFRFAHALLRDAVYDTLLPSRRRALHARAAAWFEARDLTLRAEHLEAAEAPEAADAFRAAAVEQARGYRYTRAVRLVERGLGMVQTADIRIALRLLKGELLHDLGDMSGAADAFAAAKAAAVEPLDETRALLGSAAVKRVTDDLAGAFDDVEAAVRLAGAAGAEAELARLHHLRGNLLFPRGDTKGCREAHETSLSHARNAGDRALEAAALGGIGDAAYLAGRMKTAYDALGNCVSIASEHGFGRIEVANRAQRAVAATFLFPLAEAVAEIETAREACRRVGDRRSEINSYAGTVWALFDMAEFQACAEAAETARGLVHKLGAIRYDQIFLMYLGRSLHRLGDRKAGLERLRQAADFAESSGPAFHGPECYAALAEAETERALREAALDRGDELIGAGCVGHGPLRVHPLVARVAWELGDTGRAVASIRALTAFTAAEPPAPARFYAALWQRILGEDDARQPVSLQAEGKALGLNEALRWTRESAA